MAPGLATYKDLCIDATDPGRLGAFWAAALELELRPAGEDSNAAVYLAGATPQHGVWINKVPEPRTVKQRLHLDLNVGSVEELERLGATVVDGDSFPWTVMSDPEGGELCAFVRDGRISQRLYEVGVDCADSAADAHRIASWWARLLGGRAVDDESGFSYVVDIPGAPFESLDFAPVPEPKTVKNRIHLDVSTPDVAALVEAGASVLRPRDEHIGWTVMADPDGNEFCAFTT
jgi:hypothetical protein